MPQSVISGTIAARGGTDRLVRRWDVTVAKMFSATTSSYGMIYTFNLQVHIHSTGTCPSVCGHPILVYAKMFNRDRVLLPVRVIAMVMLCLFVGPVHVAFLQRGCRDISDFIFRYRQ